MSKENQLGKVTINVFQHLCSNRDEVLRVIQDVQSDKEMLNALLSKKQYCYFYTQKISASRHYLCHFRKLREIDSNICQSAYLRVLKQIYQGLRQSIHMYENNADQTLDNMTFSKIITPSRNSRAELQYEGGSEFKKVKSKPPKHESSTNSSLSKSGEEIKKQKTGKSQSKIQSVQRKAEKQLNFQTIPQKINAKQLTVVVKCLKLKMDYNYFYGELCIKNQIINYIKDFLQKNVISFKRIERQVRILQDTSFVKSKDAGNYFFDPFCDSVQIKIKRRDGADLKKDFSVEGDLKNIDIVIVEISKIEEWDTSFLDLKPNNSINKLIAYIGEKRQQNKQEIEDLAKGLKKFGGASSIQDLFDWDKASYEKINVKPTWVYEIMETIEMIKDCNKSGSQKMENQKRRECLKNANSHKILRYLVYKNQGMKGACKLPWLNMKIVRRAIQIVRQEIHNKQLLNQLEGYFDQFALEPKNNPIPYSQGLILFGPPGTGKTVLTEALPNIMGFHLIEKGLSAADFMKSLVGESSRMIRDLANRANQSPYLLCSVGIDEVDGLIPDRKDKDEKNKGEGISMLLSIIGGNKDVPNLVFMTSTNYLKKIDEAMRRRLSGQYMVGRPNPEERQKIIVGKVEYLKKNKELLDHLILITTNFTGASLKGISNLLNKNLRTKQMDRKPCQLTQDQITNAAILIAKQFSITLGVYTLPQIYKNQSNRKNIFTKTFMERISYKFFVVKQFEKGKDSNNKFVLFYANKISRYINGQIKNLADKEEERFSLDAEKGKEFESLQMYVKQIFSKNSVKTFRAAFYNDYSELNRKIKEQVKKFQEQRKQKINIILLDYGKDKQNRTYHNSKDTLKNIIGQDSEDNNKVQGSKIYIILFVSPTCEDSQVNSIFNQICESSGGDQLQLNYSGRILVELIDQTRMAFELNSSVKEESKVAFKLFLKSQQNNSPKDVIPELVNFFTRQQVSYILLLDYELLLQNDAFEEKKMLEIMEQKMSEAKNYERVAVIINIDSLITMSENVSQSSFGNSNSYSVVNHNMYQILVNYMKEFAMVDDRNKKWISIIVKNEELVKKVKRDLNWPQYQQDIDKDNQQKQRDVEKLCVRCGAWYTDRKNEEERKCMLHPGKIIDTKTNQFTMSPVQELKVQILRQKMRNRKEENGKNGKEKEKLSQDDMYIYTCCLKNLNENGHKPYHHITKDQLELADEDELFREQTTDEYHDKCEEILKKLRGY